MSRKKRNSRARKQQQEPVKTGGRKVLLNYLQAFVFGVVISGGVALLIAQGGAGDTKFSAPSHSSPDIAGRRTVAQLMALSDAELEGVDIVEMNIAVAREIPGLEGLDYDKYRRIVDGWTDQFRRWLPTVEHAFHQAPAKYKNDINFFRLGMLAQFLDQSVGIAYVEEQKQAQIEARNTGRKAGVVYTDPGQVLLHGLIDTKRGTCGTMPALHVAIGRRMGWPVGLACANWHYVCRYDDGRHVYNIEATDTGHGGFAEGSDQDYIDKEGVSRKAVAVGSDLRKLTAREMLGVFVMLRGRYLKDTRKHQAAARDFALAYTLFPTSRKGYIQLATNLNATGEALFAFGEEGHPAQQSLMWTRYYQSLPSRGSGSGNRRNRRHPDQLLALERINAINRANTRLPQPGGQVQPPTPPQPYQPAGQPGQPPGRRPAAQPIPGAPQPHQPHQSR